MFVKLSNGVGETPKVLCTADSSSLDLLILRLAQARGTGMFSPLLRVKA